MSIATLKAGSAGDFLSNFILVINSESTVVPLIRFSDCGEALDIYRQMTIAHFDEVKTDLVFKIGGSPVTLNYEDWCAALSCLDQWYEQYIVSHETAAW